MPRQATTFQRPPIITRRDGATRRVGFELEFAGLDLATASDALRRAVDGERLADTHAEHRVQAPGLGSFTVEIDWDFLKRKARESADDDRHDWVEPLSRAAPALVPVEVVCPPMPMDRLEQLSPMVEALREAGAVGTEESLLAAYGVHINAEIPSLDAGTLQRYLRAFALLQWWLVDAHDVDTTRRLTPYIDPYPEDYLHAVLEEAADADLAQLSAQYLSYNPTRNRALDLLPLLAEIDAGRVQAVVDDARIKARPAFHYRLPNCHIEQQDWSLARPWNTWCVVERLAANPQALVQLADAFSAARRPVIGVARADWVAFLDQWLHERGLA